MLTLPSIFGCNAGDDCSYYGGWNHWIGLSPLALIFSALLFGERRARGQTQAWYWVAVTVLHTAATNLADLPTHTFGLHYVKVLLGLAVIQPLVVWPVVPRLLRWAQIDQGGRQQIAGTGSPYSLRELWARPWTTRWAEELHLSTGYGTLLLSVVYVAVLAIGRRVRWTTKAAYWAAVVAVRAAGATAVDWPG